MSFIQTYDNINVYMNLLDERLYNKRNIHQSMMGAIRYFGEKNGSPWTPQSALQIQQVPHSNRLAGPGEHPEVPRVAPTTLYTGPRVRVRFRVRVTETL
jgi:hypothetical protein